MTISAVPAYVAAFLSFCVAAYALLRGSHSFANKAFVAGMMLLSLDQLFLGLSFGSQAPSDILWWYEVRLRAQGFLPGVWLLFSLSYARTNYREFLHKWKWITFLFFLFPSLLVIALRAPMFESVTTFGHDAEWLLQLGKWGYPHQIIMLLGSVLVLMNIEKTLRAFSGGMQWQIKFLLLGVCGYFAARIYAGSDALLYDHLNASLEPVSSGAIILADFLIIVSFVRTRLEDVDIYFSQSALYNSATALFAGVYLLAVGLLTFLINALNVGWSIHLEFIFLFLCMMLLAATLLSGKVREDVKRFVVRNFKRPYYDYRHEWMAFTQQTLSVLDLKELCAVVAKMLSDTFGAPSVSIWLVSETDKSLALGGSTSLSSVPAQTLDFAGGAVSGLLAAARRSYGPIDLNDARFAEGIRDAALKLFRDGSVRYCAPLFAAGELVGFITMSEPLDGREFSLEDFDLLKTFADQTAGSLLNLKLSDRLRVAKQMEAFQAISAFFVHDLKNLASTLSLTLQNLPIHYANPEFRESALKAISQSVDKLKSMCGRLSTLDQTMELRLTEIDLNDLVASVLSSLDGCGGGDPACDFGSLPKVRIDVEKIEKVIVNLVLNAVEASGGKTGDIRIETRSLEGAVMVSVMDKGCGVAPELLAGLLFSPFKTTKKKGLGIGLFQCKTIVEAHRGRIEVESEEGKGATFRVILPER